MARGELSEAVRCAELAVRMSPLDENNQALLMAAFTAEWTTGGCRTPGARVHSALRV